MADIHYDWGGLSEPTGLELQVPCGIRVEGESKPGRALNARWGGLEHQGDKKVVRCYSTWGDVQGFPSREVTEPSVGAGTPTRKLMQWSK